MAQSAQLLPRNALIPSLAMTGTITSAARGSAHQRPKSAFSNKSAEQDCRQVGAEIGLLCVGVHRSTAQCAAYTPFGARLKGHDDKRDTGKNDAGHAVFGGSSGHQVHGGFISDVGGQQQKTETHNP